MKITKVLSDRSHRRDLGELLRATLPGRLYATRLKHYAIIRIFARWAWRHGQRLYIRILASAIVSNRAYCWRRLTTQSEFVARGGVMPHMLADRELIELDRPTVFPAADEYHLSGAGKGFEFPKIFVSTLSNALVYGGSNLVFVDGEVVCHDLYEFTRDLTSEELHGRALIDARSKRIRWLVRDEAPEPIPVAATFVDSCAANYAHWMTEVLPRIALFCFEERFRGVPIVVNEGLHRNLLESLLLVAGTGREVIMLSTDRALAVDKLYLTSAAGYVPFGRRSNRLSGHSHGVFSPQAFSRVRGLLNTLIEESSEAAGPRKIFLRRTSGTRKVTNAAEIEALLVADGYVAVEPEKLTFAQQICLFSGAERVVSATGAALANAIGCRPGAQVAVLMSKHEEMIYGYWRNLLDPFGIEVIYILGDIVSNRDLGIHGDFAIDPQCVQDFLQYAGKTE